ncbi:NAD-P-binding protein [Stereum hirsutum FP-91666 SS1]|uniref:NAD-P-binding protein n=1 Tax=Stereum hirsutum (strain FP-91666) TaxID=721885 RepID=UPI000444988C|nr:NAD-P-binding protein [Stereum hirsutum FP-91666 SS1]EIM80692.1 NAD-P-binding protein [Stereum hirsutum FP-91666 SS1]
MSANTTGSTLVWLITGTSSGIGYELALAALQRGDKVIATTRQRSFSQLQADPELKKFGTQLEVLKLDVIDPLDELKACAEKAMGFWGRVDVVVNNAGSFIAVGALEEITPEETFAQFNASLFGGLNVARAFLPYMRKQRSGKIVWIGSLTGWQGGDTLGMYAGVKHAMRGISESMDAEISPFGLRSLCIEPGYFRTKLIDAANRAPYVSRIEDYQEIISAKDEIFKSEYFDLYYKVFDPRQHHVSIELSGNQRGSTPKLCYLIVDIIRSEGLAADKPIPRSGSLQIGSDCYEVVKEKCQETLECLEVWKEVITGTDFVETEV